MPAPFAARQARVNAAVIRHLADAEAVYTPAGGSAQDDPVPVEFFNAYEFLDAQGVSSLSPALVLDLVDVPNPRNGDHYVINGTTYNTVEVRRDGAGMAVARLRLV